MKKAVRFWSTVFLSFAGVLLVAYLYDHQLGSGDGLIKAFAYLNIAKLLFGVLITVSLLHIGLISSAKTIQNVSLSIATTLILVLLLELAAYIIISLQPSGNQPTVFRRLYIPADALANKSMIAGDFLPIVGRSHLPDTAYGFRNCQGDSLRRSYNTAGAMDRARTLQNPDITRKRVAIVGDSFMEGYMVNRENRCSELLEQATGIEHLNFAVNGSNVVHYFLMYQQVAKPYNADVLLVGFLPANDFEILDRRQAYNQVDWPIYVPYWEGTYPNFQLRHTLADVTQSISHGSHTTASLLAVVDSVYATLSLGQKMKSDVLTHSNLFKLVGQAQAQRFKDGRFSKYQDFSDEEWNYVQYTFQQMVREAAGKQVLILSIPILSDLLALKQGKPNRIDARLQEYCRQAGVGFIPLAPAFLAYRGNPAALYVACDGHWSVAGERLATTYILNHPAYRKALSLPQSTTAIP